MNYTEDVKKYALAFANHIKNKDIVISIKVECYRVLSYMPVDKQVVLHNLLKDFTDEHKLSEKFENWLRQKSIIQSKLFSNDG
ncbi:MAG: hypothetical protein OHK0045_22300 [Raineya sp.]